MWPTGFGVRNPPDRSREIHIVPAHGQHLSTTRAGEKCRQKEHTESEVGLLSDRPKKQREFLRLDEPIARFLWKKLDAGRRVLTRIQAPVPSQIEHLAE